MGITDKLREALEHPFTAASSAVGLFLSLIHWSTVKAFLGAFVANAGHLFTASTVTGLTFPQIFPSLAGLKTLFLPVMALSGIAFVGRIVYNFYRDTDKRL